MGEIPDITTEINTHVSAGRVVFIGPVKSGKSSTINSLLSVNKGRIVQRATEGISVHSTTKQYSQFMCGGFLVSDTMGIEPNDGITKEDMLSVIKGHIPPEYQFDPKTPITDKSPDYKANPSKEDKVHCVILCVDASVLEQIPMETRRKMSNLLEDMTYLKVPHIILLTKIDKVSSVVGKDVSKTFESEKVKAAVRKAGEMFQVSEKYIFTVKNFTDEMHVTLYPSILLLFMLRKAMEFAQDHLELNF